MTTVLLGLLGIVAVWCLLRRPRSKLDLIAAARRYERSELMYTAPLGKRQSDAEREWRERGLEPYFFRIRIPLVTQILETITFWACSPIFLPLVLVAHLVWDIRDYWREKDEQRVKLARTLLRLIPLVQQSDLEVAMDDATELEFPPTSSARWRFWPRVLRDAFAISLAAWHRIAFGATKTRGRMREKQ